MRSFIPRAAVFATILLGGATLVRADECSTPLPSDVKLPTQQAETGNRAFIGVWGNGKWDGVLCHTLVVESLDSEGKAGVVYSAGVYAGWNIRAPAFYRVAGRVDGETLFLEFPQIKARVEYRLVDGKLQGKYITPQSVAAISLSRK